MTRPLPAPPKLPPMPHPITWGRYTASPASPVDADGAVRWRLVGPGVDRRWRWLRRDDALREIEAWLRSTGIDVQPVEVRAWMEFPGPPPEPPPPKRRRKRGRYRPPSEGPLPAWAVVDESKPYPACLIVGCDKRHNSRRLCSTHDHLARKWGVRHRIGPLATGKRS